MRQDVSLGNMCVACGCELRIVKQLVVRRIEKAQGNFVTDFHNSNTLSVEEQTLYKKIMIGILSSQKV